MKKLILIFAATFWCSQITGCIFVPAIDAYNKMGFSQADREKLLPGVVKKFQDALYWGSPNQAIEFVSADRRRDMMTQLSKDVDGIRIVESKIGAINYSEESRKATAEVTIKFFKVPFYIVTERIELQEWQFTLSDGWKLNSKSDKPKGS